MSNTLRLLARKYRTLLGLSAIERVLLVRALWLLPAVAISLQLKGLRFTRDLLSQLFRWRSLRLVESPIAPSESLETIEFEIWTTVKVVKIATRYYQPWANCLKKSLVLWILLRARGIVSEIKIGIGRDAPTFTAHAWVEYQGIVLNDADDVHQRYQAFDRLFDRPIEER